MYILIILILIIVFIFSRNLLKNKEAFTVVKNDSNPTAIALIKDGFISDVVLINRGLYKPSYWNVLLSGGTYGPNYQIGKILWNDDMSFTILNSGNDYITPPTVVFMKRNVNVVKPKNETTVTVGSWDDIPREDKNEYEGLAQDYLREQKYTQSVLEDLYPLANLTTNGNTYVLEWMYPIEFYKIKFYYNNLSMTPYPPTLSKKTKTSQPKLIKVYGYNENGVQLFEKDLFMAPLIEWNSMPIYLIKKLQIVGLKWDACEVIGRRVYWTCDEYTDFVEQIKESQMKSAGPSSEYEDDDTTILWSDILNQLPTDYRDRKKDEYISTYTKLSEQCNKKTKEQLELEKQIEQQEIELYKKKIMDEYSKRVSIRDEMIKQYEKMVAQYQLDLQDQIDAKRYGITPPDFMYTKQEIDDLKRQIESTTNVPDEVLIENCAKLDSKYNSQRKNAEKWAKASIFLPFLKKKAKRESRKAENTNDRYIKECSNIVSLDYEY